MSLTDVDWSLIPAPADSGGAAHLLGMTIPSVSLPTTSGDHVDLSAQRGLTVAYAYPMTGRPDRDLPEGWDMIPGARGCTPQSCAYRDHFSELQALGVHQLFGLSVQDTAYQQEAVERLHLPYPMISDADLSLAKAANLPTMEAGGMTLLARMTMILRDGVVEQVHYPVFPPDADAGHVIDWLKEHA